MRIKTLNIAWILILLSNAFSGLAQGTVILKASADRSTILIGEPIQLNLELNLPLGFDVIWPDLDSIAHFPILEKSKIDSVTTPETENFFTSQIFTLTSFDSGTLFLYRRLHSASAIPAISPIPSGLTSIFQILTLPKIIMTSKAYWNWPIHTSNL